MTHLDPVRGVGALWRHIPRLVRSLLRKRSLYIDLDAELDDEIRAHLEMAAEEYEARGMSPEEARRAARRDFGGVDQVKERHREARGWGWLDNVLKDVRFGVRSLFKRPSFTGTSVASLAIGVGAVTAVFAVVDGVLIRPLPFEDQDELVWVTHNAPGMDFQDLGLSAAIYATYREGTRTFEDIGVWRESQVTVTGRGEPEALSAAWVTADFLSALRVAPVAGRLISERDDVPGAPPTILLSAEYWEREFGADPGVLGSALRVSGVLHEIIGVLPSLAGVMEREPAVYLPTRLNRAAPGNWGIYSYGAIGRLRPGVSTMEATTDLERLLPVWVERFGGPNSMSTVEAMQLEHEVRALKEVVVGDVASVLWVLLGAAAIVLFMACSNVTNLALVRADDRQEEMAVRVAIGAGRGRVAGQFLLESVLLGLMGGVVGLGLALAGVRLLVSVGPENLPRLDEIGLDGAALGIAFAAAVAAGFLAGLAPALRYAARKPTSSLRPGVRGGSFGGERPGLRRALVVAQMAMALVLLAGSGLMIRSFQSLREVDPGFADPAQVLTFRVAIPETEIGNPAEVALAFENIWQGLDAIPGVTSVGASSSMAMDVANANNGPVFFEDTPLLPDQVPQAGRWKWVTAGYFETLRNPVLAGRAIGWPDIHDQAPVVVITESLAAEHWGSASAAVGQRITTSREGSPVWYEVVGVVGDVRDDGLDQPVPAIVYWPMPTGSANAAGGVQRALTFAVRTERRAAPNLLPEVQEAVWAVNGNLPLSEVRSLDRIRDRSMARTSFTLVMLAVAAAVALALGLIGIYGVISYVVSRRAGEIGLRMALGADRRAVSRMVLGQGMALAGIGIVIGVVTAVGLTQFMESLLYGVRPVDPLTFGAVAVSLAVVSLLAIYLPAHRAAATDPMNVLRRE